MVLDTGLCDEIISIGMSKYAAQQLATEFTKAELLTFSTDGMLSIDKVLDDAGYDKLEITAIVQYAYTHLAAYNTEMSRTKITVSIRRTETSCELFHNCECKYMQRMKLPCRRLLATALAIHKYGIRKIQV